MTIGTIHCTVQKSDLFRAALVQYTTAHKMQIVASKIAFNDDGSATYDISLRMDNSITINDLLTFLETNEGIRDIRCELGK